MHQTVVLSHSMYPAFKMFYFMPEEFVGQFFKDIHHGIFCGFRFPEVFQADGIEQVHISQVQGCQYVEVGGLPVGGYEIFVTGGIGRYVSDKRQGGTPLSKIAKKSEGSG